MTLSWLACDAVTGEVLADLPELDVPRISRTICRYEPAPASLPLTDAPENWRQSTRAGATNMVLVDELGRPLWGGMVLVRELTEGDAVPLSLATLEAYLDRRNVGDVTYAQVGQNDIVVDLVARFIATGPHGGIPMRVVTDGPGLLRDAAWLNSADRTVYSALIELSALEGGIEFTVEWEHLSGPERYLPVLYVGARLGQAVTPGMDPAATFDLPGCVIKASVVEDYSSNKGANVVVAASTGVGAARPTSAPQIGPPDGRPTFEYRWTPAPNISSIDTLNGHAARALAVLADGSTALTLTAFADLAPQLGEDFMIGDDIGYVLGGLERDRRRTIVTVLGDLFSNLFSNIFGGPPRLESRLLNTAGRDSVPAFPGGVSGVARCIGWERTQGGTETITPILATTGVVS